MNELTRDDFNQWAQDFKTAFIGGDFRVLSRISLERKSFLERLLPIVPDEQTRQLYLAQIHLFTGYSNYGLFKAGQEDGKSFAAIEPYASTTVYEAKSAIELTPKADYPIMLPLAHRLLLLGYECVLACRAARGDILGIYDVVKQTANTITEYRDIASREDFAPFLSNLSFTAVLVGLSEGAVTTLLQMNPMAAQNAFRDSKDALDRLAQDVKEPHILESLQKLQHMINGVNALSQGLICHEKGAYLEASNHLDQAATHLGLVDQPSLNAIGKWAKACSSLDLAIENELDAKYEAAIAGYDKTSPLFLAAADAFPTDTDTNRFLAIRSRFGAESAKYRATTAKLRRDGRTRQHEVDYIHNSRIEELMAIKSSNFDLAKLIRLCNELNTCYRNDCLLATAMLVRAILDHVCPIFGCKNFTEVANNYSSAKSFKESMKNLENSSRNIADSYLHQQIRRSESLPNPRQVNFANDLDVLLAEIVRILRQ